MTERTPEQRRAQTAAARRTLELQYREARPCGTEAAYRRHLRNGDQACPDCRAAHATYNDERATARHNRAP